MRFSAVRRTAATFVFVLVAVAARASDQAVGDSISPCRPQHFEGSTFLVCVADTRRSAIRLVLADGTGTPLRGYKRLAAALGPEQKHVRFAMNAGMFDQTGEPVGLYVEGARQLRAINLGDGPGNFYMKPNGVLWADSSGALHIDRSDLIASAKLHPMWATQSGPLLLKDGSMHPAISFDGVSTNIRNGVGLRDGHVAVFVISDEPVSFGRLARFFRDVLGCRDALYLDGFVSSIWVPALGRLDHDYPLGPMLVVLDRTH